MTSVERVECALHRKEPDRVPFMELEVDRVVADKILGRAGSDETPSDTGYYNVGVETEKHLSRILGRDNICFQARPPIFAERAAGKDGRLFYLDGRIKSRSDLGLLVLPDPEDESLYREAVEFTRQKEDFAACAVIRLGISAAMLSIGIERFCLYIHDDAAFIAEVLDRYVRWIVPTVKRLCTLGFDLLFAADDLAIKSGPLFSPRFLREVVVPRIAKVAESISLPWIFHSDGNIMPIMDDLLELGMSAIHPIEPAAMDIEEVKARYGNRVCLVGNIDVHTLVTGSPEDVRREVRERIRGVAPGGGYIVSSSNSIPAYCRPENLLAMAEAVREFGRYPIHVG